MRIRATLVGLSALAIAGAATWSIAAQDELPLAPRPGKVEVASQGEEVLARGPIHEAFAEAVSFAPKAGVVVKTELPEAIDEVPPQERPVGENVAWIPGYWGWDDERSDFIWISGVWRTVPPGRQWVGGYWAKGDGGSHWVSGYWANAELAETSYYPEPPESRERGPSGDPPSAGHVWIPGVWLWQDGEFAWRRGYWMIPQENWVWCPSHWMWTPSGYVFVDGYWDYSLQRRGIVYAPVYIARRIYSVPNYYYRPVVVINPVVFISHMFLRPDYHHYYFGDYYAADYARNGIYPRFTYQYRYGFDPLFAYQTWQHREERDWLVNVQQNFQRLQTNEADRPPRIFQQSWLNANLEGDAVSTVVATSLAQVTKNRFTSFRFEPLAEAQRKQLVTSSKQLIQLRQERQQLEAQGKEQARESTKGGAKAAPVTLKMPRTPISSATGVAARPGAKSDGPRRETLKPEDSGDPLREPRVREPGVNEPKSEDPFAPKETPKTKTPRPGEAPARPERPGTEKAPRPEREPGAPARPGAEETPARPERPGTEKAPRPEREPGAPTRPGAEETPARPDRPASEKGTRPEREPGAPTRPQRPGAEETPSRPDRPGASKAPSRPERPMDDEFPEPKSKGPPADRERPDVPKGSAPKSRPAPMDDPFDPGSKARPEPREPKEAPAAKPPERPRPEVKSPPAKSPPTKSPAPKSPSKSPAPKGKDKPPKEDDKPGEKKPEDEFPK